MKWPSKYSWTADKGLFFSSSHIKCHVRNVTRGFHFGGVLGDLCNDKGLGVETTNGGSL
jgi:hypothetical protein